MKSKILKTIAFSFAAFCSTLVLNAQPFGSAGEQTPVELGSSDSRFGYYEYLPENFNADSEATYPIIISYHGSSQVGNGTSDLSKVLSNGATRIARTGVLDAIVISPQTSYVVSSANDFLSLYNYLVANYPVDTNRVYVTGWSAGGNSTVNAMKSYSDLIAAAVPICAGNLVSNSSTFLQDKPIWVFHSFDDPTIDFNISVRNVNRIADIDSSVMDDYPYENGNDAASEDYSMEFDKDNQRWFAVTGSHEPVDKLSFTIYKDGGHNAWTRTYDNTEVWDWMFAQNLNNNVLGLEEKSVEYKLYPNPTTDVFTISSTSATNKTLEIYNLLGTKIYAGKFSTEITVDTSGYASGVYLTKVIGDNNSQKVTKLIVN